MTHNDDSDTSRECPSPDSANRPREWTSTRSGIGRWMGLVETAVDLQRTTDTPDSSERQPFEIVEEQLGRYYWFCQTIERPRSVDTCERILEGEPPAPGAWEQALAELSLITRTEAQIALERWEPPDEPDWEIFYHICRLEGSRVSSPDK